MAPVAVLLSIFILSVHYLGCRTNAVPDLGPVQNVQVMSRGPEHLFVDWDPPAESDDEIQGYTVAYREANYPPEIYAQILYSPYTFGPNESVKLLCEASGSPKPRYTWKHNGALLNSTALSGSVTQLPNSGTLVFTHPDITFEGYYQCFAENEFGISVSRIVEMKMAVLGQFLGEPQKNHYVAEGDTLILPCIPPVSRPAAHLIWVDHHSLPVNLNDRVTVDMEGRLIFTSVEKADGQDGLSYACVARNLFLRKISVGPKHVIHVQGPNQVTRRLSVVGRPPSQMNFLVGGTLNLKCIIAGDPKPFIKWEKIGSPLPEQASHSSFGQQLLIYNVQESDAGLYRCSGSNLNEVVEVQTEVRIEAAPFWKQELQNTEVNVGESVTLTCDAGGIPPPSYTWYKNGQTVMSDKSYDDRSMLTVRDFTGNIQCNASNKHGYAFVDVAVTGNIPEYTTSIQTTQSQIFIDNLNEDQEYNISIFGRTALQQGIGYSINNSTLQRGSGAPSLPQNLTVTPISSTDLLISWLPPARTEEQLTGYVIVHSTGNDAVHAVMVSGPSQTKMTLKYLYPHRKYKIRMSARNRAGESGFTEYVYAQTFGEVPSRAPQNITLETISDSSIMMKWQPPAQQVDIIEYQIAYAVATEAHPLTIQVENVSEYMFTGLLDGTEYVFKIAAMNKYGLGQMSDWYFASTSNKSLGPVQNVQVMSRGPNHLFVDWDPPAESDDEIQGYTVAYREANYPPDIYAQASYTQHTFVPNQSVILLCEASGSPKPRYTWKHNGELLNLTALSGSVTQLPNSGTLEFEHIDKIFEGYYQCFAENEFGISVSRIVEIKMAVLGQFLYEPPKNHYVAEGDTLILDCIPPVSRPAAHVFWVDHHSLPITLNDRVTVDMEGRLVFTSVEKADGQDGMTYACAVQNYYLRMISVGPKHVIHVQGPSQETRRLNVVRRPPRYMSFKVGETLRLKCIIAGDPKPFVKWDKIDYPLTDRAWSRSFGQELLIPNVQESDAGVYRCSGINLNEVVEVQTEVRIEAAPFWRHELQNTEINVGESVTLTCDAGGIPPPSYTWYRNGQTVMSDESYDGRSMLTVRDFTGNIQCNASNKHGYVFADVTVTVNIPEYTTSIQTSQIFIDNLNEDQEYNITIFGHTAVQQGIEYSIYNSTLQRGTGAPSIPQNLMITPISSTDLLITWFPPARTEEQLTGYVIAHSTGDDYDTADMVSNPSQTKMTLSYLYPNREYKVRMSARNRAGESGFTEYVYAQTFGEVPSRAPQNITLETISDSSIMMRWQPAAPYVDIKGYQITYTVLTNVQSLLTVQVGNVSRYIFTGLLDGTEYMIKIAAMNDYGYGPTSNWSIASTSKPRMKDENVSHSEGEVASLYDKLFNVSSENVMKQDMFIIRETQSDYESLTLPYINRKAHEFEQTNQLPLANVSHEDILFEDTDPATGFMLIPVQSRYITDPKDIFLAAIVRRRRIRSLRDLNSTVLPLLENINNKALGYIYNEYRVSPSQVNVYVKYQPSLYHFHVYFKHVDLDDPDFQPDCAHLLTDIIDDIELRSNYYSTKTLSFAVKRDHELCLKYRTAGYFDTALAAVRKV